MSRFVTDTLSCAYLPTTDRSLTEKEVEQIHAVDFLAILEPQLAEIQQEMFSSRTCPTVPHPSYRKGLAREER